MHELGITTSVVQICTDIASAQGVATRITQVTLEVGKLAAVMPDALRFCFEICAKGTPLEGAALEIIEIPGRAHCHDCGDDVAVAQLFDRCRCGGFNTKLIAGQELRVKQIEVTECV